MKIRLLLALSAFGVVAYCLPAQAQTIAAFKSLEDFDRCMRDNSYNGDACNDRLMVLVKKNPSLAMAAGKRARFNFNHQHALPYFEMAAKGKAESLCADEDFQLAAIAGLGLPPDYPLFKTASQLFDRCQAALLPKVKAELASGSAESYFNGNVCKLLAAKGQSPASCAPPPPVVPVAEAPPTPLTKANASTELERVKVYKGPEGERISMAFVKNSDEMIVIRFDGIRGEWNGRSFMHRYAVHGNDGADYTTDYKGGTRNSVVKRNGNYEVYAPGQPPFNVYYSEADSAAAKPADLLKTLN